MPVGLHLGTALGPPNIPSAGSLKSAAQRLVQRPTSSIRLERAGSTFSERDVELYGSDWGRQAGGDPLWLSMSTGVTPQSAY